MNEGMTGAGSTIIQLTDAVERTGTINEASEPPLIHPVQSSVAAFPCLRLLV